MATRASCLSIDGQVLLKKAVTVLNGIKAERSPTNHVLTRPSGIIQECYSISSRFKGNELVLIMLKESLSLSQTQSSPLAKRIEFLESKGLTTAEIEQAIRLASAESGAAPSAAIPVQSSQQYSPSYAQSAYSMVAPPPAVPQLDWRDYFVNLCDLFR